MSDFFMPNFKLKTPVAFIIFKRPDTTKKVFEAIRQAKPPKLFVIADGARSNIPGEAEKCAAARAIIDQVDWDCEVFKDYSEVNLGCGQRVARGITWVFEQVEEAIILEDDCLPHRDFFRFCEDLLKRYRNDSRVMAIGGTNVMGKWKYDVQSYHFSYQGSIWGWASWKRAWNYFDFDMRLWENQEVKNRIRDVIADDRQYMKKAKIFEIAYGKEINTWDYQWMFARLMQSGLTVIPSANLVSNIGFAHEDATFTKSKNSELAGIECSKFRFPIEFNEFTAVDREYEEILAQKAFINSNLLGKIINKISTLTSQYKFFNC